ncbi:hypothetical protein R3P38DRAFT_3223532 [Favolaschia claudopus]|uniref:Uncharacterized protein n=1 Tax=Favolaschia claudopus TaxID=2862362 RepID=A0AAV9ZY61_9AGAR
MLCMHDEIRPGNPLYEYVENLPGHEFKGIRGDLCSNAGMVIKNVCVNPELLKRLEGYQAPALHCRAWKLDPANYDISEAAELEALSLLGEMFHALLERFINVKLSLSEQIESLVRFSHLLCALYMQNGTSFMSDQLYSDLQTMVKNAVLTVPKVRPDSNPHSQDFLAPM